MVYLMPDGALLPITLFVCLVAGYLRNFYSKRENPTGKDLYFLQFISSLAGAVAVIAFGGGFERVSPFSLWGGIGFGAVIMLVGFFQSRAFAVGPFSYTTIIVSLSTVLPSLAGFLFFGQAPIDQFQYAGLALMILCFVFAVKRKADEKNATVKWFLLCMITFVLNGGLGIIQTWQQTWMKGEPIEFAHSDMTAFLFFSFAASTVIAALCWLGCSFKDKTPPVPRYKASVWVIFVAIGVATGLNHVINLYLVGHMASVVFFPVVNGGNLILTMLLALILDKERPTRRQWIGMGIGVVALLLLSFLNTGTVFKDIVPNVFDFQ